MLPSLKQLVEILTYIMLLLFNIFGAPKYPQTPVTIPEQYKPQVEIPSVQAPSRSLRIVQPDAAVTKRSARTLPGGSSSALADGMPGLSYSGDLSSVDEYLPGDSRRHSNASAGSGTEWETEFVPVQTRTPSLTPLVVSSVIATLATGAWLGRRAMLRRREARRAYGPE